MALEVVVDQYLFLVSTFSNEEMMWGSTLYYKHACQDKGLDSRVFAAKLSIVIILCGHHAMVVFDFVHDRSGMAAMVVMQKMTTMVIIRFSCKAVLVA